MANNVFRAKALDRLSSPEQINDYLRVTKPSMWIALVAIVLILVGALIWGSTLTIDSYATGTAVVRDGTMTLTFEDDPNAKNVGPGMSVDVGKFHTTIASVGTREDGTPIAQAETTLADGIYSVRVSYHQTQILELLFN